MVIMFVKVVTAIMLIIARYKEQVNSTSNYGRARQFYAKANHLEMRNARPFNMLAILAKISNRKFEAVYYHARYLLFGLNDSNLNALSGASLPRTRSCRARRAW